MDQSDLYLLQGVPPYHLQAIIKARHLPISRSVGEGLDPPAGTSGEATSINVTEVAPHLFEQNAIREALQGLNEIEALILRELVACGGRANSRDLALYLTMSGSLDVLKGKRVTRPLSRSNPAEAQAGTSPAARAVAHRHAPGAPPQYPAPHPHGIFEQALHRLLLLGLLFWGKQTNFVGRDYANGVYDGVLIVPRTVMEVARQGWKADSGTEQTMTVMLEEATVGTGLDSPGVRALQRMLYLYWSIVANTREGLPLINNKLLSRAALRQVLEQLGEADKSALSAINRSGEGTEQIRTESDAPYLLFMRLLLMKGGLLYEQQGALYAAPADTFFALPLLERARRCYSLWLNTPFWNELAYLPNVVVRPGPVPLDPAHEEVVRARQAVVERVLHSTPEVWHNLPTFIARTKLYIPYLLFPRQYGARTERYSIGSNPYGWDFRLRRGWLTHREGWHQVEGGFIRVIISEPLHWLGLTALTEVQHEEHPDAFRLAPGVRLITSDIPVEEGLDPPPGRLIVQPNFELLALAPVSESLLIKLDRFAERVRLEHIAQYRLTKASVTRAISMDMHTDAIQRVLEQAAGGEIPQNVRYSLAEWERQVRRIELWRGMTLLEVDDATLLDALFADEEVRPLMGRRLAPLLAEVASDQLSRVQEILWQRDYLAGVESAPAHEGLLESGRLPTQEPQWLLQEHGLLQPLHAVVNLYLAAELERFTERDDATGWRRLTPLAIRQACDSGIPLEHLVRFLQNYCEGGLPASFLIRLKLWGGGYPEQHTLRVEHAPLLSLSQQVLQDIQADEELGELLGTEVEQENRLVRVMPENLERVIELLRERGFEVSE